MTISSKCLAAILCGSLLCSMTIDESKAEGNTTTLSQQDMKEMPFKVYKENSSEVSVMNDYMAHPATIRTEQNKHYLQFKLLHPEWWKAFELYEGNQKCDVRIVSDTKDARIVEVEVTPDTKILTSKVHIIVPDIHYNHHYTTQIHLEASLPKRDETKVQPAPKVSPETQTKPDVQPKTDTQSKEVVPPKTELPKKYDAHVSKMQSLNFKVLKHQTHERSVMDQYMVHPAKVTYHNQQATVQMTLNNAAWWKSFEIYNGEKRIPVKVVSEDTQHDQRIIEFNMPKDQKMLTAKVHIIVPHLNYGHYYTTEMVFHEAASKLDESNQQSEQEGKSFQQNDGIPAPTNDSTEINETKASTIVGSPSDNNEQTPTNQSFHLAQSTKETPFITSSLPTGSTHASAVKAVTPTEETPLPEIFPKFNRNADDSEPIKFTKTHSDVGNYLKKMNQIYLGVVIVLASALLVVFTLYVRKGEGQSHEK